MKSFFVGVFGAILVLAIAAVVIPQYSDYKARTISYEIMNSLEPLQNQVSNQLMAGLPIEPKKVINQSKFIQSLEQKSDGTIIVKAKEAGQVIVLVPAKEQGKIIWHCIGGSKNDVPAKCSGT